MAWPAIKEGFTQDEFRTYVSKLRWDGWRPSLVVWHNTAAPSLRQWIATAETDKLNGRAPGSTRIQNLESFFKDNNGWSGCPHLFVANDLIWVMNPLTAPGVHSPSWNHISWGIEMIGDFANEDPDSGEGLRVKLNTIYATAVLCEAVGIDPATQIRLHKEDRRTTHNCPGSRIAVEKLAMQAAVLDLMPGGDHIDQEEVQGELSIRMGITIIADLNFRSGPSASSTSTGRLPSGVILTILDEAANATTKWLKVKTPGGYIGWVAGKYVKEGVW